MVKIVLNNLMGHSFIEWPIKWLLQYCISSFIIVISLDGLCLSSFPLFSISFDCSISLLCLFLPFCFRVVTVLLFSLVAWLWWWRCWSSSSCDRAGGLQSILLGAGWQFGFSTNQTVITAPSPPYCRAPVEGHAINPKELSMSSASRAINPQGLSVTAKQGC